MKLKGVGPDGTEVEIDTGEIDYLTTAQVAESHVPKTVVAEQYTLTAEATRAAAAARTGAEADLLKSEEFLGRFSDANTDALRKRLGIEAPDTAAEVERITTQVTTQLVDPLKIELVQEREFTGALLGRTRSADVAEACVKLGVKPDMVELLQTFYGDRAGYAREHLGWFIKEGEKFAITTAHKEGKAPYLTIAEDLAAKQGDANYKGWFIDGVRPGVDFKGVPGDKEATDLDTPDGLKKAIAALEKEGKFSEAAPLKTKLARLVSTVVKG